MAITSARAAAYRILMQVERGRAFAVDLLHSPEVDALSERDRRLANELVMGVLRWRGDLDFVIERLSGRSISSLDPEVLEILRLGVYQIRYLDEVPARAAVYEGVEMAKFARKRSAAALVNAVLRKYHRDPRPAEGILERARRAIPEWLAGRWRKHYGAAADGIVLASQSVPATCLRPADAGISREVLAAELEREGISTAPAAFSRCALRVTSGKLFSTKAWRDRHAVIQDEGSQLVAELVAPRAGETVLDVCAAPGIKAAQVAAEMRHGTYVACDKSVKRLQTMAKIGSHAWPRDVRLHRVRLDAADPLPFAAQFDRVLVDAPCSGTGTFARNPEIKWRLRPEDIARHSAEQQRLLRNALGALSPGGRLVYATCSLEPEENEGVVAPVLESSPEFAALGAEEMKHAFPALAALFDARGAFRSIPGEQPFEGYYAAVVERRSGAR